ncbi:lipopolysaccharide biosynthesis protein [Streptomyces meridianus]|uniref:Lipopolysaccharide biosynthesis protein n=1 Tax=Streptomyces meridianus TaxID=2938945 RepID=A0ABT0X7G4_9ACTN|nr:lipopolysaccharide biosynthesis protein [Streptomyces meridianus]MCM2578240.1 lipopolysaccharide biosynthesis protein [Streptomyces meridianus]
MTDTVRTEPAVPVAAPPRRRISASLPAWWPLAALAVIGALGGAAYGRLAPPEYTATGYVVAVPVGSTDPGTALGFAQAFGRVATGNGVLGQARAVTKDPVAELRDTVRAVTSPDAPMVEITGSDRSPRHAAAKVNAIARALTENANAATTNSSVRLTVFARAVTPTAPSSPSTTVAAGVGACAGGLLGGLVMLAGPGSRRRTPLSGVPAPATEPGARLTAPAGPGTATVVMSTVQPADLDPAGGAARSDRAGAR